MEELWEPLRCQGSPDLAVARAIHGPGGGTHQDSQLGAAVQITSWTEGVTAQG